MDDRDGWFAPPSPSLVKIFTEDGIYRGTGFFVAPRTVVTCAHLVEHDDRVVIGWSILDLPGRVLVRDPPSRSGAGGSYPAPDIAFIGVEILDNPSVFLDTTAVGRDLKKYFIEGFSTLNPTGQVALERRLVPVVGEADRYQLLSDMHIVPGMSGSPVVESEGSENVRGMLKSAKLAKGSSAYMIPSWEINKSFRLNKAVLRAHMRNLPTLVRPRTGTSLHMLLTAQREAAKRYPYRVASLTKRDPPPLTNVYVEQRTQSSTMRRAGNPLLVSPIELLHKHRNALIVSGAGGGKSTLLQQLVATSADWWLEEPDGAAEPLLGRVVAVRAAAQDLLDGGAWSASLARAVHNDLGGRLDSAIPPEHFERPPVSGADWLILVDGLDEIHDREARRELISVLASRVGRYGSTTRFVVASRPLEEREFARLRASLSGSDRTKRFGEYDLRPFDWERVQRFAVNWFRPTNAEQSSVEPSDFLDAIATAGLAPLVEVPLLATIAAIVFEEKPALPLPLDRAGLYEVFVRVLLTLRVQRLGVRRALRDQLAPLGRAAEEFGERLLDDRLSCLSFLAVEYLRQGRRLSDALPEWIREQYTRLPFGVTVEHVRDLLLETGLVAWRRPGLHPPELR
jgi:Trypsin-like peptidase domain